MARQVPGMSTQPKGEIIRIGDRSWTQAQWRDVPQAEKDRLIAEEHERFIAWQNKEKGLPKKEQKP